MNAPFRRFYLLRWRAAALLSLPGALLVAWYSFCAFARFDIYRRAEKAHVALSLELFQIELYDVLRQDLRHVWLAQPPEPSKIERFVFQIKRSDWEQLKRSRDQEEREYVAAALLRPGAKLPVEVRLLGQKPWNVLYRQMSLKVQLPRGELLNGYRVFTLSNDPSPMVVGEQIMLDLLSEQGVLVPRSSFARVIINGTDLGVFRYETQPDESLLRAQRREAGSMYSGDLPASAKSEELWQGVERWRKVAWREENEREDTTELAHLLTMIRQASIEQFADFAEHAIDLDAFARFEAVDIAFGCDQHNYRENHKLYFDPYRARWQPIAWGLRGFEHDPVFNRVENPLMLRLKLVPGYITRRNRALYELLTTGGSGASVRSRGLALFEKIGPELATDPYWDAYRLLPRVGEFERQMVRPMNMNRALLVFESELETYERRRAFLIEELRRNPLWIDRKETQPLAEQTSTVVDILVDGEAGASLEAFRAEWPAGCSDPSWQVSRMLDGEESAPLTALSHAQEARLQAPLELVAATRIEARPDPDPEHGAVRTRSGPMAYRFVVHAQCVPDRIAAVGLSLTTGARVHTRVASSALLADVAQKPLTRSSVPTFTAGEGAANPWTMPQPAPESLTLGPGVVEVPETRIFESHREVQIVAGTRLRMAPGASLVFLGRVRFEGSAEAPIEIERASDKPWGGIIVQGTRTAGSRFVHVIAHGGSTPKLREGRYPGMINVHDTSQIGFVGSVFSDNTASDDMVHVAYVKDLRIEDSRITGAHFDAWDIELSNAVLRRVTVIEAGDDALDLMGSEIEVSDSVLIGLRGNGVSAGEDSQVTLQDSLIAEATVGLLAKNASKIAVDGTLLFRATTGVRIYKRTVRYEGDSAVNADVLFVVDSKRAVQREDNVLEGLDLGRAQLGLPTGEALDHLRDNVLEVASWQALPDWVAQRRLSAKRLLVQQ